MMNRGAPQPTFFHRNARTILAFVLLALLLTDIFGAHGLLAMRRTQKELARLDEQIGQLNEENRKLAEQVQALKSDPRMIERIAREEMGLARPGELIFKLPPRKTESARPRPQKE